MLEQELKTAIRLAREASKDILEFYEKDFDVEEKFSFGGESEPVTVADKRASEHIVTGLRALFPDDGILSEEEVDDTHTRLASDRVWMIDPIDGTQGFVKRDGDFAVQIGLAEKGEAILGVVYIPLADILYFATQKGGAFVSIRETTPKEIYVSDKSEISDLILAVSRHHRSPKMEKVMQHLGFTNQVQRGSVGLKIGLVATQICDLYIHLFGRTKYWDSCAPQIILEEAGGKVTDIFGNRLRYDSIDVQNHDGILASNSAAHDEVLRRLQPLLLEFGRLKTTSGKS